MATISFEKFVKQAGGTTSDVKNLSAEQTSVENKPQGMFAMPSIGEVGTELKNVGTGFAKGVASSAIGTTRLLEDIGKRSLAAITPGMSYEQVKQQTGIESLKGETAKGIDELLKSDNTGEKTGKVLAFITELLTPTGSRKALTTTGEKTGKVISGVGDDLSRVITTGTEKVSGVAKGTKDIVQMGAEGLTNIPKRIATNIAEKQATATVIKQLPTKVAQTAAKEGIDPADVKDLLKIADSQKPALKKLLDVTQRFARGETKTNPIEIVGQPIIKRLKQLESARLKVGQKLGQVANNLGDVTTKEAFPQVFSSLKKVPGLSGLKVSKKGILDFTDTVLTTADTASDRKAIQSMFTKAVKGGSGKSKHLLRQEIFEVLGGKKKSLTTLTDTQEKAYEAFRKGLSNVLEGKDAQYKKLSNDFRKVIQPLQDMRKMFRGLDGASEDILDMQGGLLARRLTSLAQSNPKIRTILRAMDTATKTPGKTQLNVEALQDFYNVLDKYYDIAPKTGFQSQITSGIEKVGGLQETIVGAVKGVAGKTQATRTKALEDLLTEILQKGIK